MLIAQHSAKRMTMALLRNTTGTYITTRVHTSSSASSSHSDVGASLGADMGPVNCGVLLRGVCVENSFSFAFNGLLVVCETGE